MRTIEFTGEESPRFVRFARLALEAGCEPRVTVVGRDPLSSLHVSLAGTVREAIADRYLRYLVVEEDGSRIQYWVAGSNATRSIAVNQIVFSVSDRILKKIRDHAATNGQHVPGVAGARTRAKNPIDELDRAIAARAREHVDTLLRYLVHDDPPVTFEAAAGIRAYASIITASKRLQNTVEQALVERLASVDDIEATIRIVEDIGYVGTELSVPPLRAILSDETQEEHVCWAAIIALGRLPSGDIVEALLPFLDSKSKWLTASALLCISRRVDESHRGIVEPRCRSLLSTDGDPLLKVYACRVLSRFEAVDETTCEAVLDLFGDPETRPDVRGYAAQTMASILPRLDESTRERLERLVSETRRYIPLEVSEQEQIWGLELTAELATLLEAHGTAASVHEVLADLFQDWRGEYYRALARFGRAEEKVRQGSSAEASALFAEALRTLPCHIGLPPDAAVAIAFRYEVIQARMKLHDVVGRWSEIVDPRDLSGLAEELKEIGGVYARYSSGFAGVGDQGRMLSEREESYLKSTRQLVDVLALLVALDHASRTAEATVDPIRQQMMSIREALDRLRDTFRRS